MIKSKFHTALINPEQVFLVPRFFMCRSTHRFINISQTRPNVCTCSSPSGGLYVRSRRCRQHVWEQEDWLFVQSVVGRPQSAGTDLGETAENLPSHSPAVHASAAQPGTDTHTNSAAQVDRDTDTKGSGTWCNTQLLQNGWQKKSLKDKEVLWCQMDLKQLWMPFNLRCM